MTDQVAGRINRDVELCLSHQAKDIFTSATIRFAVSDAADTALRVIAELCQSVDVLNQARAVNAELRLGRKREAMKRDGADCSQKSNIELSTVHLTYKYSTA